MMRAEEYRLEDGAWMKRVSKADARRQYNNGEMIALFPVFARTDSMWYAACIVCNHSEPVNGGAVQAYVTDTFDKTVNAYEYYNCNTVDGWYAKYFVKK